MNGPKYSVKQLVSHITYNRKSTVKEGDRTESPAVMLDTRELESQEKITCQHEKRSFEE